MKDKVTVVSGASSGIGFELVKKLLREGTKVACCARNIQSLIELRTELKQTEDTMYIKSFDVKNEEDIIIFIKETENSLGPIDYLFNNVGANPAKAEIFDINTDDFDFMYAVNMRAPMIFTREVSNIMKKESIAGTIVNVHSSCCKFSNPTIGSYTASKTGFDALSQVFRKELRDYNIKVMNVYPGGVDTSFRALDRSDYLRPENVAQTIIQQLCLPPEIYLDDIVLRPLVERTF